MMDRGYDDKDSAGASAYTTIWSILMHSGMKLIPSLHVIVICNHLNCQVEVSH